jgi:hypothetical protein
MTATKLETAAQRNRRIARQKASEVELEEVSCGCGCVWKCRKPSLQVFVTSGMLPLDLAEKFAKVAAKGAGDGQMMDSLSVHDQIRTVEFNSKIVKYVAVEPRIVEHVSDPDKEMSQEEMMQCCYYTLTRWAKEKQGGEQAEGLNNFRGERPGDPVDGTDGA